MSASVPDEMLRAALQLHALGANVVAIPARAKGPTYKWGKWHTQRQTAKDVKQLPWNGSQHVRAAAGVGVVNGINGWRSLDLDDCPTVGPMDALVQALGLPVDYPWVEQTGDGWHLWLICQEELPVGALPVKTGAAGVWSGLSKDGTFGHLELRWHKNQTIIAPSLHCASGKRYCWRGGRPRELPATVGIDAILAAFDHIARRDDGLPRARLRTKHVLPLHGDPKEDIRHHFNMVAYAVQAFGGDARQEGDEVRITGHGGLLIKPGEDVWYNFSDEVGGDCFDLVGKALFDDRWDRANPRMFGETLREAAEFAGVRLPGQTLARRAAHRPHDGDALDGRKLANRHTADSSDTGTDQAAAWEPPVPFHEFCLPVFPTAALPGWLQAFVEAEATATQTPRDLAGLLALAVCAAACATKVKVCVIDGYVEPVNLFTVVALPPGNRKSAVFAALVAPVEAYEEAEAQRMAPEIAEAQTRHKIMEARLQKAQTDAAKAKPADRDVCEQEAMQLARDLAAIQVPVAPRLIADDASPERLATLLHDHQGRMAVMSPEGDVFDLMAGRYSGNGMPNFGVFLKGHAGDALRVDRVGRPPEYVKSPALTLGLAVQPDVLRGLTAKPAFRGRGLLARFLYALPSSLLGTRDTQPPPVPPQVRQIYQQSVRALLDLPTGTDDQGKPAAHVLRLATPAQAELHAFQRWVEPQLAEFGDLGSMTDWGGKLVGTVVRIAGLLHMAGHAGRPAPWDTPIGEETVQRAIQIGQYLIPHARAAFAEMGADPEVEDARYVLHWIEQRGCSTFKKTEVFEGTRGRFKKVAAMEPALALLSTHGYIRPQPMEERAGPGRKPSLTYEVNPRWRP